MVLVVIVVVLWMVILVPSFMRRRSGSGDEIGSISHFHQQLRVLEQSAPQPIVAPAYRLRAVDDNGDPRVLSTEGDSPPVLTVVGADQLPRPALAFLGDEPTAGPEQSDLRADGPLLETDGIGEPEVAPPLASPMADNGDRRFEDEGGWSESGSIVPVRLADPVTRQLVRRRRRDILGLLTGAVLLTAVVGFIPGASAAWMVTAVLSVALAAYVGLLVNLRRRAEEKEQKLRYLRPEAAGPGETRISGRYAHPSNQAVAVR
jgi:hypothetical protein